MKWQTGSKCETVSETLELDLSGRGALDPEPMGAIQGTKDWRFTLQGAVPPGMSDEAVKVMVLHSITIATALLQFVGMAEVQLVDITPSGDGQGLRLRS